MKTITISVSRALSRIKHLDEKIKTYFTDATRMFVSATIGEQKKPATPTFATAKDLQARIQSDWDGLDEMIRERTAIKRALVLNNAACTIEVFGLGRITIAEAIELKSMMNAKTELLKSIRTQISHVNKFLETTDERVNKMIAETQRVQISEQESAEDRARIQEEIAKNIRRVSEAHLFDPISLIEKEKALETMIDDIRHELDFKLTETNSTTMLTVTF